MPAAGRIVWDASTKHLFQTGVDRGVLFVQNGNGHDNGVPWNGLTGVTESPSGAEATVLWADNIKYAELRSAEEFGFTIEAYDRPDEFMQCDGEYMLHTGMGVGQQVRKGFAFSYRTLIGNEVQGTDYGYRLHIIYGAKASPSERSHSTVNDSPEGETMSWECTTTPIATGWKDASNNDLKPVAHIYFDKGKVPDAFLTALENMIYGTDAGEGATASAPTLPMPSDINTLWTTYGGNAG